MDDSVDRVATKRARTAEEGDGPKVELKSREVFDDKTDVTDDPQTTAKLTKAHLKAMEDQFQEEVWRQDRALAHEGKSHGLWQARSIRAKAERQGKSYEAKKSRIRDRPSPACTERPSNRSQWMSRVSVSG